MGLVQSRLQFLWSSETIAHVFSPLFTFSPVPHANAALEFERQLQEIHSACDLYMGILLKFPSQYTRVMSSLAIGSGKKLIMCIWNWLKTNHVLVRFEGVGCGVDPRLVNLMWIFLAAYSHLMFIIDDDEFHETQIPLRILFRLLRRAFSRFVVPLTSLVTDLSEVASLIEILKRYVFTVHMATTVSPTPDEIHLTGVASRLLNQLRERDGRRAIRSSIVPQVKGALANLWRMPELENLDEERIFNDAGLQHVLALLPFASSFQTRYILFRDTMAEEIRRYRSDWVGQMTKLKIRRDQLILDGFEGFSKMSPDALKSHVRVKFVDAHGISEAGIDGGGLFKEFLTDLIKETFKPSYGLFVEGEDKLLCPNPGALKLYLEYVCKAATPSAPHELISI